MKKSEQEKINTLCASMLDKVNDEIVSCGGLKEWERLRTCNARVSETANYYILCSYNTLVAFIDKNTDTLYDVLRYVYGYTATSAQHISKFEKDYCQGQWHCENRYTMR